MTPVKASSFGHRIGFCRRYPGGRRYDVHPNLIANWKKKAREHVLASFAGTHEYQEASRAVEIKELRAKVGELVIERDFLSKAFGR